MIMGNVLLLLLKVYQVLTLLEDLSYSQRHQPRILLSSLVLKGLRRNLTAKWGHLLKQRLLISSHLNLY
uniref:Uncharacterized protein n=1 Tax=Arundo donax TaxID=35708 RepID=A0A0A9CRE3_ARUDO